jgi:hypothetical protein
MVGARGIESGTAGARRIVMDERTKADKLRAIIERDTTIEGERQAAMNALRRLMQQAEQAEPVVDDLDPLGSEDAINDAVTALAFVVVEDDFAVRSVGGTAWTVQGKPMRTWDVLRFLADVLEHG